MWPLQKDCDAFYGDPRGAVGRSNPAWEAANLVHVSPPFKMYYAGRPVLSVKIHRKCADSLGRVFAAIWEAAKHDQATIDRWGVSIFGGSYNFRLMRGSSHLSMHSYGCAIDLAPERFPMGTHNHTFVPQVIQAFANEGWENLPNDRMHFQAARVPGLAVPVSKPAILKPTQPPKGVSIMSVAPSHNTINIASIIAMIGGYGALLPKVTAEYGTFGMIAAGALAVGMLIQAFLPTGTAAGVVAVVADDIIPAAEAFKPSLKPTLDQVSQGLHDAALAYAAPRT